MKKNVNPTSELNTAVGVIFHLADGTIQSCNAEVEALLGYTVEQLVGTSAFDPPWQTIHEDGSIFLPETYPAIFSLRTGRVCSDVVMGFYKPSGELVWLSIDTLPLFKADNTQAYGVEVTFRDITQNIEAQITRQNSSQKTSPTQVKRLLTDFLPGIIYVYDVIAEHNTYINDQTYNILGYTVSEISQLGENFVAQVMHPEDLARFPAHLSRLRNSQREEVYNFEYRMRHKNGEWRWFNSQDKVHTRLPDGSIHQILGVAQEIHNRKQIEEHLSQSEERLKLATVAGRLGMWFWDLTTDCLEWTEQCKALFGLNPDTEMSYEVFLNALYPEDRERADAAVQEALETKTEYKIEYRTVWSDGSIHWILAQGRGFYNPESRPVRMIGIAQDITERINNQKALEQREEELRLITEAIPQQIWTALPNGETDYFNQRWQDYTGLTVEQANNRGWEYMIHPDDLADVKEMWHRCLTTGCNYNLKTRLRRADGEFEWFLVRARPLRNQRGEVVRWYGTNTNINQIKELEAKLQQQTEDLIQANQLKDEFLAIVSHELRTPLNPILGWSQLLSAGRLKPERYAQGVGIIQRNAKLQANLIDDLLDVSRILRGKLKLKTKPLNLETIVRSALTTVQLSANSKSIEIVTSFEPNIGQVSGDASRLQQIVWNLVSNAIKFTPEGGQVTVSLKGVGTQALIQVIDTGKGIEPEFLPYVFERFRQAESSRTRKFGGLGLGLAIVRHLTELHGGTVAADSLGENRGATFSVRLPLINTPTVRQFEDEQSNKTIELNPLNGLRVLIVDDDVDSLDLLTLVLEQDGAKVTAVESAKAARSAFNESTPDLIISDIGMPEVDGYTLINQIRALPQGKNIPAIALTAYAGEVDKQRSIDAGYQQHIPKPINLTELISVVTIIMQKNRCT
ncbi:Histidine kinase [Hyella patelloides LEGE 07179]|uniref:Circadian input-output histidine kinase CikA n=1 Tax=Hyella patelloides LEGE 07179 TaxID=945734 RepID=A0A563W4T2_9CYAN|nr:hybrid sensor histidine kinase/response regulator [Hyella patelloides]VEP18647.1 Histidine kinase [Hyella patelloides LEGE 07179]